MRSLKAYALGLFLFLISFVDLKNKLKYKRTPYCMKTTVFLSASLFILIFTSCGPAAEDRKMMHDRAKVFQDSIANIIRTSMAEAEGSANTTVMQQTPAATASPSTSANPNAK
jgi:hypothetical protein